VTAEAVKVLETLRKSRALPVELVTFDWGAEKYLREGVTLPEGALEMIRRFGWLAWNARGWRLDLRTIVRPCFESEERPCREEIWTDETLSEGQQLAFRSRPRPCSRCPRRSTPGSRS
jgi:hypothetical protein